MKGFTSSLDVGICRTPSYTADACAYII